MRRREVCLQNNSSEITEPPQSPPRPLLPENRSRVSDKMMKELGVDPPSWKKGAAAVAAAATTGLFTESVSEREQRNGTPARVPAPLTQRYWRYLLTIFQPA